MRIVFMGTPAFSVPALQALADAGHEIAAVYTQPPRPAGRGQKERPSAVQACAEALGLPVRSPRTLRSSQAQDELLALRPELAVVVAYGLILPRPVLDAPTRGCLNIHASLLPRWRGAAPIHRAVLAGDVETGVCIMGMEEGLDTGPVFARRATPIGPQDTTGDLHDRLAAMGAELVVDTLSRLGALVPEPQPDDGATYAAKVNKDEARIDWTRRAAEVDRQIRGLSPFPGAWALAGGERLKLLRSRLVDGDGEPGQIISGLRVACGSGAIEILEAQRQGRRPMQQDEFLRGHPLNGRLD